MTNPLAPRSRWTAPVAAAGDGGMTMRHFRTTGLACAVRLCASLGPTASAEDLPEGYFRLLETELKPLQAEADLKTNPGAMFAAAVLYSKQHPANPSFRDKKKLDLALA